MFYQPLEGWKSNLAEYERKCGRNGIIELFASSVLLSAPTDLCKYLLLETDLKYDISKKNHDPTYRILNTQYFIIFVPSHYEFITTTKVVEYSPGYEPMLFNLKYLVISIVNLHL